MSEIRGCTCPACQREHLLGPGPAYTNGDPMDPEDVRFIRMLTVVCRVLYLLIAAAAGYLLVALITGS